MKDTRAGDERTPGPERPAGNECVAAPQAGMYRYFLSMLDPSGRIALHAHRLVIDASIPVVVAAVDQDEDGLQQLVGQGEDRAR